MIRPITTSLVLFLMCSSTLFATSPPVPAKSIEPIETWRGVQRTANRHRELIPPSRAIIDRDAWANLWQAWRPTEEVPEIDFDKHIVLVASVSGPNSLGIARLELDAKGDVRMMLNCTQTFGPGFGYLLIQIDREGVKSANRIALDATEYPKSSPRSERRTNIGLPSFR
ncbi:MULTISPECIES: hypothetical protein [Pirellulaceae]|nr:MULTISPECIES: hypothetical protein [Pirellulaceae]